MKFIRSDSNNWPIFLVHLLDAEDILTSLDSIIIEFVPQRDSCDFWAWESCQRVEGQTIDVKSNDVDDYQTCNCWPVEEDLEKCHESEDYDTFRADDGRVGNRESECWTIGRIRFEKQC